MPVTALSQRSRILGPEAVNGFIDGVCDFDIDRVSMELGEDVQLSIGGRLCAAGKARVRHALIRAMGSVYSIECVPAAVWVERNVAVIEADVLCLRLDGAQVGFPVVLRFRDQLIFEIRVLTYEPAAGSNFRVLRGPVVGSAPHAKRD